MFSCTSAAAADPTGSPCETAAARPPESDLTALPPQIGARLEALLSEVHRRAPAGAGAAGRLPAAGAGPRHLPRAAAGRRRLPVRPGAVGGDGRRHARGRRPPPERRTSTCWGRARATTSAPARTPGSTASTLGRSRRWRTTRSPASRQPWPTWSRGRRRASPLAGVVHDAAGDDGHGDRHRAQRRAERRPCRRGRGRAAAGRGRAAPGRRGSRPRPSAGRRRRRPAPRATVSACSPCHGSRSSALRCTAAAIASHGSSGETGASEPSASSTPSSSIQRNAKQRSAAARPDPLGEVAVVEQVGRLDAGPDAELGHPAYVVAADQLGVLDRAAGAGVGVRRQRLGDGRVADRVGRDLEAAARGRGASSSRSSAPERFGWPEGYSSRCASPYGSQHQAVRVLSEPSLMILSGPIVSRSSQPGSGSPVRRPASITSSRVSAYVAHRTRSRSQPCGPPLGPARRRLPPNSKSTMPDDALGGRGVEGPPVGLRRGAVVADERDQPRVDREPLGLADHRVAHRQRQVHAAPWC